MALLKLHSPQTERRAVEFHCQFGACPKLHSSQTVHPAFAGLFKFWSPLKLRSSQTITCSECDTDLFGTPLKLHSSQTLLSSVWICSRFMAPLESHGSQTQSSSATTQRMFETPFKLHISNACNSIALCEQLLHSAQTHTSQIILPRALDPPDELRSSWANAPRYDRRTFVLVSKEFQSERGHNYTALKHLTRSFRTDGTLKLLLNYTAFKPCRPDTRMPPLWDFS